MSEKRFWISSVEFSETGMVIQYTSVPEDVRMGGALVKQSALMISGAHPEYGEQINDLMTKIEDVLREALEDFADSEVHVAPQDDLGDDDEKGMGDG